MATLIGLVCKNWWGNDCPDYSLQHRMSYNHECFVLVPIPRAVLSNTRRTGSRLRPNFRAVIKKYHPRGPCQCSCGEKQEVT